VPPEIDKRAVVVEAHVDCVSNRESLWRAVANTERLNRAIGLGRITLLPNQNDSAARFVVDTVSGGFGMSYEERPSSSSKTSIFSVRRVVKKGLALSIENTFELATSEQDAGTRVSVRIGVVPKYPILSPIFRLQIQRLVRRMQSEIARVDRELAAGNPLAAFTAEPSPVDLDELERRAAALRSRLGPERSSIVQRLVELVAKAPDPDVGRIRPFELAERWGLERRDVLTACLNGVLDGLFELSWELVCPSCRTSAERKPTLSDLGREGHCQLCDISFELELDRAVEAVFRPPRELRRFDEGPYCVGGPAVTPHVVSQAILPAAGTAILRAPMAPGRHRCPRVARSPPSTPPDAQSGRGSRSRHLSAELSRSHQRRGRRGAAGRQRTTRVVSGDTRRSRNRARCSRCRRFAVNSLAGAACRPRCASRGSAAIHG
jgi:hypothetical protein